MNEKSLAAEFVKEHKITEYSSYELIRVFNKLGFVVEDKNSEKAEQYYNLLDISVSDRDSYFLCNKLGVKAVFIDFQALESVKCHQLSVLLKNTDVTDSRACCDNEIISSYEFSVYLKEAVCDGTVLSTKFNNIKKYAMLALSAIFSIFVIFICLFTPESYKNDKNPLEDGVYINGQSDEISNDDNCAVQVFSDNFDIKSLDADNIPSVPQSHISFEEIISDNNPVENVIESDATDIVAVDTNIDYSDESEIYYVTKAGKKYHVQGCGYLKDLSQCTAISKEDLHIYSYEPCKRCCS